VRAGNRRFRNERFDVTMSKAAQVLVAERFDRAAQFYDEAASVQAEVAKHLLELTKQHVARPPRTILDIGSGTGMAAALAQHIWPAAKITAMDGAPGMLQQARGKLKHLQVVAGDIAGELPQQSFDLVLSSMALHWLADPAAVLRRWQQLLNPGGTLFAALLTQGSFAEWRALCARANLEDGLWNMPHADFADGFAAATEKQILTVTYPSAHAFLQRLKATGATMPRTGHKPFSAAVMRRLLANAPRPFPVTYEVLYIA